MVFKPQGSNLDSSYGRLIVSDIIPAISMLQKQFSLKFTTMFAYTILLDLQQPLSILSDDIEASDRLFDSVIYE